MGRRLFDSPAPFFVLGGLLLLAAVASQFRLHVPSRPVAPVEALLGLRDRDDLNLVFLLIDTLRADRLGVYGYARPTSPVIDEAAAWGVVFDDVVAQSSWTKSSMASLWTATHPIRNGVLRYDHVLPDAAVMPAEILRDAGFRTVGLWRNGWVEGNFGFAQGFDLYLRPTVGAQRVRVHRQARTVGPVAGSDEDLTISAVDFLEKFGDERFFLYVHTMDVHQYAYDEASAIFGTSYSDLYDQAIRWTDRLVGTLLEELESRGLLARTLVVIGSDHGEAFREHGFEGHARNLYTEVTRVPWIVLPPFRIEGGVRVPGTVSNVDLWPTLLDLLGLPALPDPDGRSLVPRILAAGGARADATAGDGARPAFGQILRGWGRPRRERAPSILSVTEGRLHLIENPGGALELYDRDADPAEQTNLAAADPETAQRLRARLAEYESSAGPPWEVAPGRVELDELRLNQLRALGYLVDR